MRIFTFFVCGFRQTGYVHDTRTEMARKRRGKSMVRRVATRTGASRAVRGSVKGPFRLPVEGEGTALQSALLSFPGRLIGRTPAVTREEIQVPILAGEPRISGTGAV